jgi:hypothetical protein
MRANFIRAVVFFLCGAVMGCRSEQRPAKVSARSSAVTFVGIAPVMEPFANFYRDRLPDMRARLGNNKAQGMVLNVVSSKAGLRCNFHAIDIAYTPGKRHRGDNSSLRLRGWLLRGRSHCISSSGPSNFPAWGPSRKTRRIGLRWWNGSDGENYSRPVGDTVI